ncbi:MAG: hypothetical protein K8F91_25630 [Candidatus Obscuribacterales bacterium]|nr:hypothetical protein [Candidatus Obscuribacterales bacterium]
MTIPGRSRTKQKRRRRARSSGGAYLLELLVSMIVGAFIALALTNMYSESLRLSSSNQNETYAQDAMTELTDYVKACKYGFLSSKIGDHTILINRSSGSEPGPDIRLSSGADPLPPALLDMANLDWEDKVVQSRFSDANSITMSIQPGPNPGADPSDPDTLKITITVSWKDSKNYAQARTLMSSLTRTRYGIDMNEP